MSEATVVPANAQLAPARARRKGLNPLEALERGFALFQSTFAREGWRYYAGAAPLVVCFIPMWVIDGQIRISSGVLLLEAAALAGAYVLRSWAVARYMERIRERAFGVPALTPADVGARLSVLGRLIAWKFVLSVATLATLPTVAGASWFYGGCQFASLEAREDAAERHSLRECLALSGQWFGGGLLLFLMLFPLWIAVWLNAFILALVLPALLHSIFGLNTFLSTAMGMNALGESSAFWLSLFAGAWLALDPIVKCTYVVAYQYLRSRREGDDLRGMIASLPREQAKKAEMTAFGGARRSATIGALLIVMALLGVAPSIARGAQVSSSQSSPAKAADSAQSARVQELRQALDVESQRSIYRWHDAEHPTQPTWFDKLMTRIGLAIKHAWDAAWNFIHRLWPRGLNFSPDTGKHGAWQLRDLRFWVALVLALTLLAGAVLFWLRRRRGDTQLSIPIEASPLPDLSDAAIATERSEDEWFALANLLEGQGELRLALRAAYLGLLAGLAQRQWLTIRRDRTNREYLDEFTRRWRRRPQAAVEARAEIPEKLRGSLRLFDRVWYGSYGLTPAAVAAYRDDQRELLNHV